MSQLILKKIYQFYTYTDNHFHLFGAYNASGTNFLIYSSLKSSYEVENLPILQARSLKLKEALLHPHLQNRSIPLKGVTIKNYMAQVPCILVEHHSMGDIIIIKYFQ